MLLHINTKKYESQCTRKKSQTREHSQGPYSWILFPWVYLIVFRNNAETDDNDGFHSNNEGCKTKLFFTLTHAD